MSPQDKSLSEATLREGLAKARGILAETRTLIQDAVQKDFRFQRKAELGHRD
jgi:hypothetical protein